MTDDERISDASVRHTPRGLYGLPLPDWEALPLSTRVADRLSEAMVIAEELRTELKGDEALCVAWIGPEVEEVLERLGSVLGRLAS